jgi:lipopolysaccharide/colanic/teichoic acid biosynthesis glycosyltransferase
VDRELLRALRLDELPQLFNVLVGDIGPRPLLPQDQPTNCGLRLTVRPGITGWAQINDGNLVTTEEKGALDDWYVHNASVWLDLRVALYRFSFCSPVSVDSNERCKRPTSCRPIAN